MDQTQKKKWLRPLLFTAGGALIGLVYYFLVGCESGSCPITSSPWSSMLYMGALGWLFSGVLGGGCCCGGGGCNL